MPEIRVLPPLVVNQIAAGEVVERPASVVKELTDNALDSGATRIAVELERGGIELVRVIDDGGGIPREQLPLAVHPHATSKVRDAEDLDSIGTMGFRGEALASIASVGRLSIRSRTAGSDAAYEIAVDGGEEREVRPASGPVGTRVEVRNLFYNTPARRKFLRTPQTEQGHCVEVVRRLAMAHPSIGFRVRCDGRDVIDVPAEQSPRARVLALLGNELESQVLEAHADALDDDRGILLWGLVGNPALAKQTNKHQHVFLNGRPIRDKTIAHALREAFRGLIEPGRHPLCALMIEMHPGAVDVNVHPAKTEVRFRDGGMVHKAVYHAVREALRGADLTPTATSARQTESGPRFEPVVPAPSSVSGYTPSAGARGFAQALASQPAPAQGFPYAEMKRAVEREQSEVPETTTPVRTLEDALPTPRRRDPVLQVHNSFLVTQDEGGVVIIDQHALHERVMFEKLKDRLAEGNLQSQHLLTPAVVETTAGRAGIVEALGGLLERLGIELTPLGPTTVGVTSFPTFLFERSVEPEPFVADLLERAEEDGYASLEDADAADARREEALHEVLDMMACKAAIKAGDTLSDEELGELLALRDRVERASNCPHGRPTAIRLTIAELEKQFGRS